jgi:hypothetical protein
LIAAWQGQGSRSPQLNKILKSIFACTVRFNLDLKMQYIHTKENPADAPSRSISKQDATLAEDTWAVIERSFGPHTCDLMALDSNTMVGKDGPLRHFTPYPTPLSSGINVFAQKVENELNLFLHHFPWFRPCLVS